MSTVALAGAAEANSTFVSLGSAQFNDSARSFNSGGLWHTSASAKAASRNPAYRGCPRLYTRREFHRAARRTYRGAEKVNSFQRRTIRRVTRCQRVSAPKAKRLVRTHHKRYRAAHRERRRRARILSWGNRGIGYLMLEARGRLGEWGCLDALVAHESSWNHLAVNPTSGAYGLPQSLPAEKLASAGADWRTNPRTQLRWLCGYADGRYGSICGAWAYWQRVGWY